MFERAIGWLAEDGIVVVSMFRNFGSRYIWSRLQTDGFERLASCRGEGRYDKEGLGRQGMATHRTHV